MLQKLLQRKKRTYFFLGLSLCLIICLAVPFTLWAKTSGEITYEITAGEYQLIPATGGACQIKMTGADYGVMGVPGDPALPEKIIKIPVPLDADLTGLKLTMVHQETSTLEGSYDVIPQSPPCKDGQADRGSGALIASGKNLNVYQKDSDYPGESLELLTPVTEKEVDATKSSRIKPSFKVSKYIRVAYRPFLYNPVTQKLKLIKKATIQLTYQGNLAATTNRAGASKTLAATYNPLSASEALADYVIITTNNIVANSAWLDDFVQMKELMGHTVRVVTEDDYGSLTGQAPNGTAEKIRQWLIDHEAPYGVPLGIINYVLLIGDPDPDDPLDPSDSVGDIPMKMCYPRYYEIDARECPTDNFYADLTGNWDLDGDQLFGVDANLGVNHPESPDPAIGPDTFSAQWSGLVFCEFAEEYGFTTISDDGVRVYIDNNLVIDNWTDHHPTTDTTSAIPMTLGLHRITVKYRENTGHGVMKLLWGTTVGDTDPHYVPRQIIPQDHLCYIDPGTGSYVVGGLNVKYYDNDDLTGTFIERIDPTIDFIWGTDDDGPGEREPAADVFVGRIPVYDNDYTNLDQILSKIIQYETDPSDISWRRSILIPIKPSDQKTPGYPLGEAIRTNVGIPAGFDVHRIYDDFTPIGPAAETMPCNITNVATEWQNGYGMVTWFTHGVQQAASEIIDHYPPNSTVDSLDDTKPSFTFQASCETGWPENPDNLGYALLRHGGIATVSSSRISWYSPGNTNIDNPTSDLSECFAYAYTKNVISWGYSAGVALYEAKSYFPAVHMGAMDYNLYGDPGCFLTYTAPYALLPNAPLSFENPAKPWTPVFTGLTLSQDTVLYTEGTSSLKLNGTGYMAIRSTVFSSWEIRTYSNQMSLDIYLPSPPTNPYWLGAVELIITAPSAGIYDQSLGQIQLTGLPVGQWNTIQFTLPPNIVNLFSGSYSDIQISLSVNTSQVASNPYRLDNLRFTGTLITK
ncbi:MAG TPA: C25 family cysteine peptidase [Bacillota bacterium]|nr:C25 family cysteine peptidase [Bacillota bacterium]